LSILELSTLRATVTLSFLLSWVLQATLGTL